MNTENLFYYETKIGKIGIVENGLAVTHLFFGDFRRSDVNIIETPLLKKAIQQLQDYLDGKRETVDLLLEPQGTSFQRKVWKALQEIPYGKTCSYKEIAKKVGNVKACRAVGMANNKNPIAIFIPCHRVIGTNGKLVGYAAGLDVKEKLLEIERQYTDS